MRNDPYTGRAVRHHDGVIGEVISATPRARNLWLLHVKVGPGRKDAWRSERVELVPDGTARKGLVVFAGAGRRPAGAPRAASDVSPYLLPALRKEFGNGAPRWI